MNLQVDAQSPIPIRRQLTEQLKRVIESGMTRDEARQARRPKQRARPYVYRFQPPGHEYTLELRFRRSGVGPAEVALALEEALAGLRGTGEGSGH